MYSCRTHIAATGIKIPPTPADYDDSHLYMEEKDVDRRNKPKWVEQLDAVNQKLVRLYESINAAAKETGISKQIIEGALASKANTLAGGYLWRFADSSTVEKRKEQWALSDLGVSKVGSESIHAYI